MIQKITFTSIMVFEKNVNVPYLEKNIKVSFDW